MKKVKLYGIVDKLEIEPGKYNLIHPITISINNNIGNFTGNAITTALISGAVVISPLVGIGMGVYKIAENFINLSKKEEFALYKKNYAFTVEGFAEINIDHFYEVNQIERLKVTEGNNMKTNDIVKRYSILNTLFDHKPSRYNKIMKDCTQLIIYERKNIPEKILHYGGENGKFSYGLYCEHPKNENILIPLNEYPKIVKKLISEEIIQAFEKCGAKSIRIRDITKTTVDAKASVNKKANAEAQFNSEHEIFTEKRFGKRKYSSLDLDNFYFISDYPTMTTIIQSREKGNQTYEKFKESVNINMNLNIDVLEIFEGKSNFNYKRDWEFEVEFYDKNEM